VPRHIFPGEATVSVFPLVVWLATGAWRIDGGDSLGVLRSARRAQEAFEATRRYNLPERYGGWSGVCGERIGRICYWYEGGDDEETPPEEPVRIRQARAKLLAALDEALAASPGDEWITGQRVRYLLEDGQPQQAARAAAECRAVRWWCDALAGLVRHVTGDFVGADSVFAAALAAMPHDERCSWTDISSLLEGTLADRYRELDCAGRSAFEARWWWLAQPLYSQAGNDRRTEHFARRVMVRIHEGRRTTFGLYWENDLRDVLVRYGWPTWWTREPRASPLLQSEPYVTGHSPSPAFHFAPAAHALDQPERASPEDWTIDGRQARERYAPAYAAAFGALEHQAAVFTRGDSCIVVAAANLSDDTLFADRPTTTALVLAADEHDMTVARDSGLARGRARALVARAACRPVVMSLEAIAPGERHVARARYGLTPTPDQRDHAAISDVLLFDPSPFDSLPGSLEAVVRHTRGSTRIPAGRKVGVFWEVYGLAPAGEEVTTSVMVTRAGSGWLRRAVESVGLASRRREVGLEWDQVLIPQERDPRVASRALALDLSGVSPGRYRIEVTVTGPGRASLTATRDIEVVRD
jgi:hypothetical protein